jgi:hypothetical protein
VLDFKLVCGVAALLDKAFGVSELEVGLVLLRRRNPAVANQQAAELPLVFGGWELVSGENCLGDVWDVLSGIGFTCDV